MIGIIEGGGGLFDRGTKRFFSSLPILPAQQPSSLFRRFLEVRGYFGNRSLVDLSSLLLPDEPKSLIIPILLQS